LTAGRAKRSKNAPPLEVGQSMAAAMEALDDIRQICVRKPEVCETGSETFAALGIRAKEGARIAYEFLDAKFTDGEDALITGSLPPSRHGGRHRHQLTADDGLRFRLQTWTGQAQVYRLHDAANDQLQPRLTRRRRETALPPGGAFFSRAPDRDPGAAKR
jgi:hypothetical protein